MENETSGEMEYPYQQMPESVWKKMYHDNKGAVLILFAEAVGTSMDAIVRFLQQGDRGIHPYQIIFARMSGTVVLSSIYMWWTNVPDFPLGRPEVRGILIIRALFGFFGLWCLYYSVHFLPLAEAMIFRFLVPVVTAWACSIFLGSSFTRKELGVGLIALVGVVIIAHPSAIFGSQSLTKHAVNMLFMTKAGDKDNEVSSSQRLLAIAISVLGVMGASGAYTMIRVIGDRAHALISVNYFAIVSTVGSTAILLLTPNIGFTRPQGAREWVLLTALGVLGFVLQFLLTAGLQLDKSSKATSMMYTQILFALMFDWTIWGVLPSLWSIVGGVIVIASTLWLALQKPQTTTKETAKVPVADEETPLLREESAEDAAERRPSIPV